MQRNQLVSRYSSAIPCGRYLGTVMRFGSFARTSRFAFSSISASVRCPRIRFRACLMSTVPSASRGTGLLAGISLTSLSQILTSPSPPAVQRFPRFQPPPRFSALIGKKSRTEARLRSDAPPPKTFSGWG